MNGIACHDHHDGRADHKCREEIEKGLSDAHVSLSVFRLAPGRIGFDVALNLAFPPRAIFKQPFLVIEQFFTGLGGKFEIGTFDDGIHRTGLLAEAAINAHKGAGNTLAYGEIPEDVPEVIINLEAGVTDLPISAILNRAKLVKNAASAKDVLARGVVFVDGQAVNADYRMTLGQSKVIQAGKKAIAKVTLQD